MAVVLKQTIIIQGSCVLRLRIMFNDLSNFQRSYFLFTMFKLDKLFTQYTPTQGPSDLRFLLNCLLAV